MPILGKRRANYTYVKRNRRRLAMGLKPLAKYKSYKKYPRKYSRFANKVMKVVNQRAEQKIQFRQLVNNQVLLHNSIQNLESNVFHIGNGTNGEQIATGAGALRVGQKIFVKGIKVCLNLESQQYRPSVNYWLYLVRRKISPHDAITSKDHMFEGVSTTIPCDYIDTSKCQVIFSKKFNPKMPNTGVSTVMQSASNNPGQPDGTAFKVFNDLDYELFTNPQVISKFYVPINKTISYQDHNDGTVERETPTDYWHYQWVMYGYDNFTTNTANATYPLGHITMSQKILFTDV